ncbi:MAG TPA: hypothetical protein VFA20_26475 [Myxococcaceae bacterium]|nr:hypothetical protein [Myxococcaceae bacterium]
MPRRAPEDFDSNIAEASSALAGGAFAKQKINDANVAELYATTRSLFRALLRRDGFREEAVRALLTKFNDAGPRSAPWRPVSSKVPGRPQDGKDGNRINRWELPSGHKFYATRVDGTLVAVKYIFQALSMTGAPRAPSQVARAFSWLVGHEVAPGAFLDPIRRSEVRLKAVAEDPRLVTSGHLVPLDRGGRHTPSNTSLMLKTSNDLQGNNTFEELILLCEEIVRRHRSRPE